MNEIIKYGNDFNYLIMPNFTEREMDVFIKILSKLMEGRTAKISINELAIGIGGSHESLSKILAIFKSFSSKILGFNIFLTNKKESNAFVCFEKLKFVHESGMIEITAQKDFYDIFTNYKLGFTQFELFEFIDLTGKYSKILYRLLKQFKITGSVNIFKTRWEDFCKLMQIPANMPQSKINERILKPAIKELSTKLSFENKNSPIFKNLAYKKIKDPSSRGRGGKVIGIEFYFTPNKKDVLEAKNDIDVKKKERYILKQFLEFESKEERAAYLKEKAKNSSNI